MIDTVIDISESQAYLKVENKLLVIDCRDKGKSTIPLKEIGVLVISNKAVTVTHAVLSGIAEAGGIVVVSNDKHQPSGMLLPLQGHHLQAERFISQASVSLPGKKNVWKKIIAAKIKNQAALLKYIKGKDYGLSSLVSKVRSGDPQNIEALSAKKYWKELQLITKRDRFALDDNIFLNYGYTVLHAATARAICSAGLHPAIGIHHHNRYNPFCLASDLMEPFRPLIDAAVIQIAEKNIEELNKTSKAMLIKAITNGRVYVSGEQQTVFRALTRTAATLASAYQNSNYDIILPELIFYQNQ